MELWKMGVLTGALAIAAFTMVPFSEQGEIATIPQHSYASDMQLQAKRSAVDFPLDGDPDKPSWNSGFEHATSIDAKNHIWTAEMRIPVSSMSLSAIRPGAEWRVNFFRAAGIILEAIS